MTGANGAVGREILRMGPSPELVAVVRSGRAVAELRPAAGAARITRVAYDDVSDLAAAFAGADAVVHLVGVLVEGPGSTYEEANVQTTRLVIAAARRRDVTKLVFVSATGADAGSPNRYWRSKGEAESLIRASGVPHTIVRTPMLLGRGTEAAMTLRRRASRRLVPLLGGGRTRQQPLAVTDLARAVLIACDPALAKGGMLDLVGPVSVPGREIVERAARSIGRRVTIVPVPVRPIRLALTMARRAGWRAWSPDALEVLTTDTELDPAPAARALGITLTSLGEQVRDSLAP